tara:strand:+ start:228 stop:1082 length:855 start_codon:yes stop_codon:yes gene_type:complete
MKDRKFDIPKLKMRLPRFLSFRIPIGNGIHLGGGKLILGSMSAVAIGFIASMFILISSGDQQITFPMTGASYDAPGQIGSRIVDEEFPAEQSQTLQLNIPANTRIKEITFENISLGKFGLVDSFQISGSSTTDLITIGTVIIEDSEFPTMDWANGDIYSIVATTSVEAAGHTFSPTMSSSTNDVVVGSSRGSTSYIAKDMIVDRILILQSTTGGDVIIETLTLKNVDAFAGAFNADYFEIGTLILRNLKVGDDGEIDSSDFYINNSVNINNILDGVQDKPIFIR